LEVLVAVQPHVPLKMGWLVGKENVNAKIGATFSNQNEDNVLYKLEGVVGKILIVLNWRLAINYKKIGVDAVQQFKNLIIKNRVL
jgi:hypothetical protein